LTAALAAKIDGTGAIQRWLVNMPVNASDVELSVSGFIKGVAITKAIATVAPDKKVQAAADAAAEALDAANAAIDAANSAAEAADAATAAAQDAADAVAALAVTTQAQIASMRLQNIALSKKIIALTALVNKLLKK
jgi:trimeric autotransporter adhesin